MNFSPVRCFVVATLLLCTTHTHAYYVAGSQIYADNGSPVSLRGISWFGFETGTNSPHGLWAREMSDMIAQMKTHGFNAVRIPISPSVLRAAPASGIDWSLNPDLWGLNSLELLDKVVKDLSAQGLYVLLDHHRPNDEAISPLWYTSDYSEQEWLDHLVFMAERYRDVERYLGIELKNEPHGVASWGAGNPATDWNKAAERAAAAVLEANPRLLVFVGGIARNDLCSEGVGHWWGGNLEPIRCTPLDIPDHKLVLAPHVYGPDVYPQSYFSSGDFPSNMPAIWDTHFGFAQDYGYTLVLTEFGSRYADSASAAESVWFDALIDYLMQRGLNNSFYWSWNPNSHDTGGILKDDWSSVWEDKLQKLHALWGYEALHTPDPSSPPEAPQDEVAIPTGQNPTAPPDKSEPQTPAASPDATEDHGMEAVLQVTKEIYDDWATGYCARYRVRNESEQRVRWRVQLPFNDTLQSSWHGVLWVEDGVLTATGPSWAPSVAPFETATFYLCAQRKEAEPDATPHQTLVRTLEGVQTMTSNWGSGYCAKVRVDNKTDERVIWQSDMPVRATIYDSWSVVLSESSGLVRASGVDWNAELASGASAHFGFCATR
ncbi:MAG: cellulase family glycosylhydrolase [Algiphilus sp.]